MLVGEVILNYFCLLVMVSMVSVKMVSLLFLVDYLTETNNNQNQAICSLAN